MQDSKKTYKTEDERQHLSFIQNIIARMNGCSFHLKQWMVTLVAAVLGLSLTVPAAKAFVLVALLPVFIFWFLDAYYLHQARKYRALYNKCLHGKTGRLYDLNTGKNLSGFCEYVKVVFSKTIFPLYFPLVGLIVLLFIYKR